jgi:imidazolonepropionase-like amidohydrolase
MVVELKNGRFVDVIKGCYFDPGVRVLLKDGKILVMPGLPGEPQDITPDFSIDLQEKTVLPGLFNTHCHIQLTLPSLMSGVCDLWFNHKYGAQQVAKNMTDCLAHGITTIRDAWTEDLRLNRALRERISRGEIPGPRIAQSILVSPVGGSFAPQRGLMDRMMFALVGMPQVDYEQTASGVVSFRPEASPQEVRDAVDRAIDERGAEYLKIYDQREKRLTYESGATLMTLAQLAALTDQARRRGVLTTMHQITVESFRRGVQTGVSSLAHLPRDDRLTEADVKAFIDSACLLEPTSSLTYYLCWPVPGDQDAAHPRMERLTQCRRQTYAALSEAYWIPELRRSVRQGVEKADRGQMRMMGWLDMAHVFRYYAGILAHGIDNLKWLFAQGACLACANDAGAVPCTEAMILQELELLTLFLNEEPGAKKFSGADALRIATINSAKALGLEKLLGSIETGKIADLVMVEGDPFTDVQVIGSRVAALFMDGKLVINNCGLQMVSTEKP